MYVLPQNTQLRYKNLPTYKTAQLPKKFKFLFCVFIFSLFIVCSYKGPEITARNIAKRSQLFDF